MNILKQQLNPLEEKLLSAMAPSGMKFVGLINSPSNTYTEDFISYVWVAFNHGRHLLKKDVSKAIAVAIAQLSKHL